MSYNNPYPANHKRHRLWNWLYRHEVPLSDVPPVPLRLEGYMYLVTKDGFTDTPIWNDIYTALLFIRDDFLKKYHFQPTVVLSAIIDKLERRKDWEGKPHPYNRLDFHIVYKGDGNLYASLTFTGYEWVGEEMRQIDTFTIEGKVEDGPRPLMPKRMREDPITVENQRLMQGQVIETVARAIVEKNVVQYAAHPFKRAVFSGSTTQPKQLLYKWEQFCNELLRQLPGTIPGPGGIATRNPYIVHVILGELKRIYQYIDNGDENTVVEITLSPNDNKFEENGFTHTTMRKATMSLEVWQRDKLKSRGNLISIQGNLYFLPQDKS